jgi:general secretion pathway protein A
MTLWEDKLGRDYRLENYLRKWGLRQDPFTPELPTPAAFVPIQKEDLLKLKWLLLEGKVGILTGGLGMGKTTVCEFLTAALREESILTTDPEKQAIPVFLHGAVYKSVDEFLRALILALELDANRDPAALFEMLRRWGIEHREKLAVIIDDVPESTADFQQIGEFLRVLADLPHISILFNGEYRKMKRFLEKVPALRDRIQLHVKLKELNLVETRELLQFRLRHAGYPQTNELITPRGFESVHKISRGVPRLVLKVASRSLRFAAMHDVPIDAWVVERASRRSFLRRIFGR